MSRSKGRWSAKSGQLQNIPRQSEAYRQTMADRKARQLAKQRAEVEIANMHFTTEGDFSHLSATPMRIRHA